MPEGRDLFQDLYDSEINFQITTFWDAGFNLRLGDEVNGFVAETTVKTFREAFAWFYDQALLHYPNSDFAKRVASKYES